MKMLSIDVSGKTAAVAVTSGDELLAQNFSNSGFTHSQTLLPMIDSALSLAGIAIHDIDEFALTCGPGSFTGLRIGVAQVMGLAGSRPCRPVSTLAALAMNARDENSFIIPVMDARRAQVYTAVFESDGNTVRRITPDEALPATQVLERINQYNTHKKVIVLGDGAYMFENAANSLPNVSIPEGKSVYTQGYSVAKAAFDVTGISCEKIKINYLRMSQAERELKEKQI